MSLRREYESSAKTKFIYIPLGILCLTFMCIFHLLPKFIDYLCLYFIVMFNFLRTFIFFLIHTWVYDNLAQRHLYSILLFNSNCLSLSCIHVHCHGTMSSLYILCRPSAIPAYSPCIFNIVNTFNSLLIYAQHLRFSLVFIATQKHRYIAFHCMSIAE
jgi:hypothetical protein